MEFCIAYIWFFSIHNSGELNLRKQEFAGMLWAADADG